MSSVVMTEIIEASVNQLTEHSLQAQLSPDMKTKEYANLLADIKKNGILQPLIVTKGFKVIDGRHRLKIAKELGINNVTIVFADIPENEIASYIVSTKLQRDNLTKGQRAAIVINLHYEDERRKAKERQVLSGELYGIGKEKVTPEMEGAISEGETAEIIAKMSGVGKTNIYYLLAVKDKRPDLYEKVYNGAYSIGKAHTQMKLDEMPPTTKEERDDELSEQGAELVKGLAENSASTVAYDASKPSNDPYNVAVGLQNSALDMSMTVMSDLRALKEVKDDTVKRKAQKQLLSLAQSCVISLGQTIADDDDADLLEVCLELLNKIGGKLND